MDISKLATYACFGHGEMCAVSVDNIIPKGCLYVRLSDVEEMLNKTKDENLKLLGLRFTNSETTKDQLGLKHLKEDIFVISEVVNMMIYNQISDKASLIFIRDRLRDLAK